MTFRCRPDADWLFDRFNDADDARRAESIEGPPVTPSARLAAVVSGEPIEDCPLPGDLPEGSKYGRTAPMSDAGRARHAEAFRRTCVRWGGHAAAARMRNRAAR